MEYKELSKLLPMSSSLDRFAEVDLQAEYRRSMPSSFDIGVDAANGRLFVAMPREMSVLYERVLRTERKVSTMMLSIPLIAQMAFTRSLVLEEVVNTNAIEDIHSTRRQAKEALDSAAGGSAHLRRFKELARLTSNSARPSTKCPAPPDDIRAIYDKAMDGEPSESKKPDGRLFRAEGADITAGGVKVVHSGLEPKDRIIEAMEQMLGLVRRDDMPEAISAIASHYVFEYAHPFYDGNGRTGRYLLSLFLSEAFSAPTVLSLSRAIAENRDVYYRAFKTVEDPLNRGELTFFVYNLLELVRLAQMGVIDSVERSKASFEAMSGKMKDLVARFKLSEKEACLVFALSQFELFGMFGSASLDELAQSIDLGKQMTRKHISALEKKDIVRKTGYRPAAFALTDEAKDALGRDGKQ